MEVLIFKSENGNVKITASTAADMANCWRRFRARVEDSEIAKSESKASLYCDYHSTLKGTLELASPQNHFHLEPVSDENATEWKEQPPVFLRNR